MPSQASLAERNSRYSSGAYITLLEIRLPTGTTLYLAHNSEDVEWPAGSGRSWTAFDLDMDDIDESSKAEVRQVTFKVSNTSRAILRHVEELEEWRKVNGREPCTLILRVVNSKLLEQEEPEAEHWFEDQGVSCPPPMRWVFFRVGADSPFRRPCPRRRILRDFCSWTRAEECQHAPQCDKTLRTCRTTFANTRNFGGFPEAESGGAYV
jgi:phage-related protein